MCIRDRSGTLFGLGSAAEAIVIPSAASAVLTEINGVAETRKISVFQDFIPSGTFTISGELTHPDIDFTPAYTGIGVATISGTAIQKFVGTELYDKQLGLIGFGKAANEVAKRLTAFGMKIVFYDPYIEESKHEATKVDLDYLLQTSDVISIHVNKTKETQNLIDSEALNMIKEGGIIVNTSRGGIIDEKSLFELVDDKKIIFGGLDVYEKEPPIVDEFFSNSNIVTTPHLGASTKEAQLKAGKQTAENVKDILNGDLSSVINK